MKITLEIYMIAHTLVFWWMPWYTATTEHSMHLYCVLNQIVIDAVTSGHTFLDILFHLFSWFYTCLGVLTGGSDDWSDAVRCRGGNGLVYALFKLFGELIVVSKQEGVVCCFTLAILGCYLYHLLSSFIYLPIWRSSRYVSMLMCPQWGLYRGENTNTWK